MSPDNVKQLVALPWTLQIVLASGYCAYLLSYFGLRHHHKAADTVFSSLAFGLIAATVLALAGPWLIDVAAGAIAFAAALVAGAIWRLWGRNLLWAGLRKYGFSWKDNTVSAWERLLSEQHAPTQLTVELKDGRYLLCTDTRPVSGLPFAPYVLGDSGDVLMYVTGSIDRHGAQQEIAIDAGPDWGTLLTYIPKDEIRKVSIRFFPD